MFRHIDFPALKDGALITTAPPESIGAGNFAVRRNFRRTDGVDQRIEGWGHFNPDGLDNVPTEGFDGDVNLVVTAKQANGATCTVVGTQTSLYRRWSGFQFAEDGMFDPGFIGELDGWEVIGTGFSANGHRWEAVNCAGFLVLNNGADLPLTYRPYDTQANEMKELRESGVARVGAITETAGILILCDVTQIDTDALEDLLQTSQAYDEYTDDTTIDRFQYRVMWALPGIPYRFVPSVACTTNEGSRIITLAVPMGSLEIGQEIVVVGGGINGGNLVTTVQFIYEDGVTVLLEEAPSTTSSGSTVAAGSANYNPGVAKSISGIPGTGASVSFDGLIPGETYIFTAGENEDGAEIWTIEYVDDWWQYSWATKPYTGITEGQVVEFVAATTRVDIVVDAGLAGQPFTGSLVRSGESDIYLAKADAVGSIAGGFDDLQGDGGGIVNAEKLGRYVVIYKEDAIFIGAYTGSSTTPFDFERTHSEGGQSLPYQYRHTLTRVFGSNGEFHLYAGDDSFYSFDGSSRTPKLMSALHAVRDVFFKNAPKGDQDSIWSAVSRPTQEVVFKFPAATGDDTIKFDYIRNSCHTSDTAITAAGTVKEFGRRVFLMGVTGDNKLVRLGSIDAEEIEGVTATVSGSAITTVEPVLDIEHCGGWSAVFDSGEVFAIKSVSSSTAGTVYNAPAADVTGPCKLVPRMWTRLGQGYSSVLESGRDPFGVPHAEKNIDGHVVLINEDGFVGPVLVEVLGKMTPKGAMTVIGSRTITSAKDGLTPVIGMAYYIGDRLTVSGDDNPVSISSRIMSIDGVNTRSYGRQS